MKRIILSFFIAAALMPAVHVSGQTATVAATAKSVIKKEEVSYTSADGTNLKSYVAYNEMKKGKRPAIIVIPEWWGINAYVKKRADMLASLGYIAIAIDMYGEGKQGPTPKEAGELAGPFYGNPQLAKDRIDAAINKLKEYEQTDETNMACIGYCFGGTMSLFAAKLDMPFKSVVSFHGGLAGIPNVGGVTSTKILVCHGGADKFITAEDEKLFKSNLDSLKVDYKFISYPGATHAFSNPEATAKGKKFKIPIAYNPAADKKSWADMRAFLKKTLK
ncbi:MAG: dienelactone hydrolase family protein [Ferruginibacter sp.]